MKLRNSGKTLLLVFLLVFSFQLSTFAADLSQISRASIIATVQHIQALAQEQKVQLEKAQADFKRQSEELQQARSDAAKFKAACAQAEKERDALIWIFAIACGSVALSAFRPALEVVQMPWQLIALAGVFAGGFALGFSIGRWALRFLAEFTPHLPF